MRSAPNLQGCYTQGQTYEEVIENIRDAIQLHTQDRLESGEEIPHPGRGSPSELTTILELHLGAYGR